ncbi:c-type cytochrome [Pedobacter sp. GR22-6]|uniref:c-type cytochrome n=1 Tax=Pedobacter sp. GR22-6 TaxID=3127957 RepID=UPI00307E81D3
MKITHIITIGLFASLTGCSSADSPKSPSTSDTIVSQKTEESAMPLAVQENTPPSDYLAGKELIEKSDCLSCHHQTKKVVGPAYVNIAIKYGGNEAEAETLADKIIAGGSGAWGDIPMTPHPGLNKSDALTMVKYILSLKK